MAAGNNMPYLLDTNIILEAIAFGGIITDTKEDGVAALSVITVMELLVLPGLSEEEEQQIRSILERCIVLPVDFSVASLAGALKRTRRTSATDLLIAATAIIQQRILVTKNLRDFRNISGLAITDHLD